MVLLKKRTKHIKQSSLEEYEKRKKNEAWDQTITLIKYDWIRQRLYAREREREKRMKSLHSAKFYDNEWERRCDPLFRFVINFSRERKSFINNPNYSFDGISMNKKSELAAKKKKTQKITNSILKKYNYYFCFHPRATKGVHFFLRIRCSFLYHR